MTTYIGWVPTVGRRLSYSIIGSSSHPSVAEIANVADDQKRRILCLQNRTLLDSALPIFKPALARRFFNLSGSFVFFLDAESNNDFSSENQMLNGKLYLFTDSVDKNTDEKVLCIREAINKLNNFDSPFVSESIDDFYSEINKKHFNNIEKYSIFKACFRLDRDGIIEIDIEANTDKELEHTICAQLFFFIKDISHRHQHHHPKTDTILDIYNKDNSHWQDEVLRALYKRVLDFKRSRNEWVYSSALGVLSYIKAFKKVCDERDIKITVVRDDNDLSESIEIAQNELRHITSQKVGFRNAFITTMIALIGAMLMLSSLGTIANPAVQILSNATFIKLVADNIINNPFNIILVVLVISQGVSMYIYNDYWFGKTNWFKDITRLFMSCRSQVLSGVLMILMSIILAMFAFAGKVVFDLIDK
jgi:hypothetical protein